MTEGGCSLQRQKDRCWWMVQLHHELQCIDLAQTIPQDNWQYCACVVTFELFIKEHDVACIFNVGGDQKLWNLVTMAFGASLSESTVHTSVFNSCSVFVYMSSFRIVNSSLAYCMWMLTRRLRQWQDTEKDEQREVPLQWGRETDEAVATSWNWGATKS